MKSNHKRLVLGVTSAQSLRLLEGYPNYLSEQGWDVHVVCSDPPALSGTNWSFHSIEMHRNPAPFHDLRSLLDWVRLLGRLRPAAVISGTPKAGLLGILAAAIMRVPVRIYLLRGLRLSTETGIRRTILAQLERLSSFMATEVQSVSHSLQQEYVDYGLAAKHKVFVIGSGSSNGVAIPSEEELAPRELRRSQLEIPEGPTLGYVGRIHPDKGLDVLIRAFADPELSQTSQLLLIGPEDSSGYLAHLLGKLDAKARSRVLVTGPKADPTPYYRAMDALVLPTRREGFPNVILEAASFSTPAVASRVTGCVDAIEDGATGMLFDVDDPAALASSLMRIITDSELRDKMGSAARSRAIHLFRREDLWRENSSHIEQAIEIRTGASEA